MKLKRLLAFASLFCAWSTAAPIAKITAVQGLLINGKQLPDKTAPTWPVVGHDAIVTTNNPAVLVLPKGDRALLEPESSIRVLERDGVVTLELMGGEMCLLIHGKSDLQLLPADAASSITYPFEGSVTLRASQRKAAVRRGGCRVRPGASTVGKNVVIGAVVADAAMAAGTAALATGKAVTAISPSQP